MTAAMKNRLKKLESRSLAGDQRVLIIVTSAGRDPSEMVGVYGIDLTRIALESIEAFTERLEAHLKASRGRAGPYLGIARFADDVD